MSTKELSSSAIVKDLNTDCFRSAADYPKRDFWVKEDLDEVQTKVNELLVPRGVKIKAMYLKLSSSKPTVDVDYVAEGEKHSFDTKICIGKGIEQKIADAVLSDVEASSEW